MKMQIVCISDLVPGHQAEVLYKFEYKLRCNRGSESKTGQRFCVPPGCGTAIGSIRETFALIAK